MFQGPKGYIAQICEVHMETVQQNGRFTRFPSNSTLIYILFSLYTTSSFTTYTQPIPITFKSS